MRSHPKLTRRSAPGRRRGMAVVKDGFAWKAAWAVSCVVAPHVPVVALAQIGGEVVEPTGEARYTIPLVTPPGTAGTGPDHRPGR